MSLVSELKEWSDLSSYASCLLEDKQRFIKEVTPVQTCVQCGALELDLSKQLIDESIIRSLQKYSSKVQAVSKVESIFIGEKLNVSEDNSVTHAAYRSIELFKHGSEFSKLECEANRSLEQIKMLSCKVRETDSPFTDVVNIGIGGSDLGPRFVIEALTPFQETDLRFHFVSNIDPYAISSILDKLDPCKTMVVVSSKSFGTFETIENAKVARSWLADSGVLEEHLFAITAQKDKALSFGIKEANILPMHEGVGGRFSVFTSIGALIAIAIGFENFNAFLAGGNAIDRHVLSYRDKNIAHLKALVDFWNINFLGATSHAIIPYAEQLKLLIPYLQQLMMESNGKSVSFDGCEINYQTCPIIWGGVGSASQHSFHQLLMQGTNQLAVDFIRIKEACANPSSQQALLNRQLDSQSKALWMGNHQTETDRLKKVKGLQPHSIITLNDISPRSLGALLAFYEYQTIYLGMLWGINSFDQPGVELGKKLSLEPESELEPFL
jgi:glucose-6-phosphate isomerase